MPIPKSLAWSKLRSTITFSLYIRHDSLIRHSFPVGIIFEVKTSPYCVMCLISVMMIRLALMSLHMINFLEILSPKSGIWCDVHISSNSSRSPHFLSSFLLRVSSEAEEVLILHLINRHGGIAGLKSEVIWDSLSFLRLIHPNLKLNEPIHLFLFILGAFCLKECSFGIFLRNLKVIWKSNGRRSWAQESGCRHQVHIET